MDKLEQSQKFLERMERYADDVNDLCKQVPFNSVTKEIVDQLTRSSSSPAANYIEALESLSKRDFYFRIRICRKESREAGFWLRRLGNACSQLKEKCIKLEAESREYVLIFSKILSKYSNE